MESMAKDLKKIKGRKESAEVGIVTAIEPHFKFTINGSEYSSEFFTIYLPAVDRIRHFEKIDVETYVKTNDPNPHESFRVNNGAGKGEAYIDIGDLELEPDKYERRFLIGDLIDVTDRGDSFIVHGRLIKIGDEEELHEQTHRDVKKTVEKDKYEKINRPPLPW